MTVKVYKEWHSNSVNRNKTKTTLLTWIEEAFGEDLLLFLVLDTGQLWKITEHFVAHDHNSTAVLPVTQQFTSTPVVLHTAHLIDLNNRNEPPWKVNAHNTVTMHTSDNPFPKAIVLGTYQIPFVLATTYILINGILCFIPRRVRLSLLVDKICQYQSGLNGNPVPLINRLKVCMHLC